MCQVTGGEVNKHAYYKKNGEVIDALSNMFLHFLFTSTFGIMGLVCFVSFLGRLSTFFCASICFSSCVVITFDALKLYLFYF